MKMILILNLLFSSQAFAQSKLNDSKGPCKAGYLYNAKKNRCVLDDETGKFVKKYKPSGKQGPCFDGYIFNPKSNVCYQADLYESEFGKNPVKKQGPCKTDYLYNIQKNVCELGTHDTNKEQKYKPPGKQGACSNGYIYHEKNYCLLADDYLKLKTMLENEEIKISPATYPDSDTTVPSESFKAQ